jgi:hypothetical protein
MARQRLVIFLTVVFCAEMVALSGNVSAAVQLSLKLDKGKTYYQRGIADQKIIQTIRGKEENISYILGLGQKLDVLDVDGQGNMTIRHTYLWVRYKQSGFLGEADYDSSQPSTSTAGAEGFAALIGESYIVKMSPKGKVLDVNGVEQMVESIRKKVPPGTDVAPPGSHLAYLLDKQGIWEMEEEMMGIYPDEPVELGASWVEKKTTTRSLELITEERRTLQKREAGVSTIVETGLAKSDPSAPPAGSGLVKTKMDVAGTEEGTIQMDERTGLIRTDRSRQVLKGQMNVGASAEGPFDLMVIPTTMTATSTLETSDRMWEAPK